MNPANEKLVSEKETQMLLVEAVANRVAKFTHEIEELDRIESENGYETFDPTKTAEMFGRGDITLQEYFYGEISNLRIGMNTISDKGIGKWLFSEISALLIKIDKVFKPENFIVEYVGIMGAILEVIDHITHKPDESKHIPTALSQVEKMVSIFNTFVKTRNIKIDEEAQEEIIGINKLLMHHQIPEIITMRD